MKTKRTILAAIVLILALAVPACGGESSGSLNRKKIIFVGCSYTYYGNIVHRGTMDIDVQNGVFRLADRVNDQAFFYQLCKANGAEVQVTDWTYGGHDLTDLFDGSCAAERGCNGWDHLSYLTDLKYDYVVLQDITVPGVETPEGYLQIVKDIMAVFKKANSKTKFFYVIHDGVYTQHYPSYWKQAVRLIEQEGVTILDWGTLVWDVANGITEVPGAAHEYNKQSFIISRTSADGYHPNQLSGYLFTLMTYSAITGTSAVGQPYEFCTADMDALNRFIKSKYAYDFKETPEDERVTNYVEILTSAADIEGLQTLVDEYLKNPSKLTKDYTVRFVNEDGSPVQEKTYQYGDTVEWETPANPGDSAGAYEFAGWDREVTDCFGDAVYTAVYRKK